MGRGATKSAADKVAELAQKADSQKRAAQLQEKLDLELMRLAKIFNPYQFSINKRSATWEKIANGMNDIPDTPDKGFSERRCRERVTKLVKAYRLKEKPRTGDGTEDKSEIDLLIEFCIEEEDKTENCKKETVEKEAAMKAVVTQIQMQALRTIVPRREVESPQGPASDEEGSPNPRMQPDSAQPKKPAYTKRVVTNSPAVEKRRKPGDASEAYLAAKREQHEQDNRTKMEIAKMEMKDREAERKDREAERRDREEERAVKREKQAYEARKLEMEAADRDRRFEMEKADRQGILDVLKLALAGRKTD